MPLVVNGVTIPENVANALMVNGVSVTQVIANGVAVWTQSLNLTWSGDSLSAGYGLTVSSNLFRHNNPSSSGIWLTANLNGTFSGGTSTATAVPSTNLVTYGNNTLNLTNIVNSSMMASLITYVKGSGFSGGGFNASFTLTYATASGLLRLGSKIGGTTTYGNWVALN